MKNPLFLMPLVAALFSLSLPAQSADYHVMVPAPGKVASYASIKLELNPASLPVGVLGEPYAGFDFNTALRITGDPELDMSEVSWSRYSGEMPDGLTLARDGSLHGIPSQTGNATFQALAKYKTKTALRTYTAAINDVTLILDAAPPQAHPLREYSYSLADHLVIKGDPGYSPAAVAWSLIEGTLPSGLNLSDDGTISGKPSSAGQYVITFQASYKGRSVSKPLQLDVVWIEINIQEESGARQWEDGRFADSCMSYMHPSGIYHYSGAIGDGVYRIARGENAPSVTIDVRSFFVNI